MTLGRREADSHRQGLRDPAPSHPCEGDVMPFLQMRKLRPRAEVMCARPSQDVLTWRQGGPGPLYGRVCSQPGGPAPPPASGQRGVAETPPRGCGWFCCRVRLALLQGLSQLPGRASQANCLPCTEEGRLLSGLISCQLSVFFLCFCCSLRQTDGVGRNRTSRVGLS